MDARVDVVEIFGHFTAEIVFMLVQTHAVVNLNADADVRCHIIGKTGTHFKGKCNRWIAILLGD